MAAIELFTAATPNGQKISIVLEEFSIPYKTTPIDLGADQQKNTRNYFSFKDADEKSEMVQWLFFQNAGVGPMQGQANRFFRYAPKKIQYGIDRYQNETRRLYSVLEARLSEERREYLVGKSGGKYSIADISTFAWVRCAPWAGVDLSKFPKLDAWRAQIEARPAVQKGLLAPNGEDQIVKWRENPDVDDPFKSRGNYTLLPIFFLSTVAFRPSHVA
ncbi:glutathione S-transferase [Lophiotrema nucula]|uniref:Glutathione S-transferase n=1 Tax=Lophiotrema nucula TaxID=690887 RepID=A0A6A5YQ42_9PLEO|nr:glutathione S-transferase [Lophiotrema nucula]